MKSNMKNVNSWLIASLVAGLFMCVLAYVHSQTNLVPDTTPPVAYGITITPEQAVKLNDSITSILPLIPTKYQGYVAGAILLVGLLAKAGRLYTGYKVGGWTGALRAVFTGSVTASTPDPAAQSAPYKKVGIIAILLITSLAFTGCTSVLNCPTGKVFSISEHVIGLEVASASSTTMTPTIRFGFTSTTIVVIPTSTNGPTFVPDFADTFDNSDTSPFSVNISENLGSGHVATYVSGVTNSAVQTTPVFSPYGTNYVTK